MAVQQTRLNTVYGYPNPQKSLSQDPIVSPRAPLSSDLAQIGTEWVQTGSPGTIWFLSGIVAGTAYWVSSSSGAGSFSSLTVNPGPTNLSTVGNGAVTIGNSSNTGALTISVGSGNFALNGNGNTVGIANDAAANVVTIGSNTGAASLTLQAGSGNFAINPAAAATITIGNSAQTGKVSVADSTAALTVDLMNGVNTGTQTLNIANAATGANSVVNILSGVGTAGASQLLMADNTRVTTIDLGNIAPAASRTITIAGGNQAQNDTVNILNGAPSANTQTFNLMCGTATGGTQNVNLANGIGGTLTVNMANGANTSAQTVNISSGAGAASATVNILNAAYSAGTQRFLVMSTGTTRAGQVQIGNGGAAHSVTLGSTTNGATTTLQAGSDVAGNLTFGSGGMVSMNAGTVSAAAYAATLNTQVGSVTLTGQVLASAATQVLTITNSICTTASQVFVTVANLGTNDAQLTVTRIQPQAGSFLVTVKNNGAAALNGDIHVSFWIYQP